MNATFRKGFNKCNLLGLTVILIFSGCGLNNTELENNPNKSNNASTQTGSTETEKQEIKELSFQPVKISQPEPRTPSKEWTVAMEENIGDTMIALYKENTDSGFDTAFAKHAGNFYMLSSVYDAETVRIQPLKGVFGGIKLIAGVGSDGNEWNVLGVDKNKNFVMFSVIAQPEFIDLDSDGTKELVASFLGTHLNFPDIEILRFKNGHMESARVIDAYGDMEVPYYARTVNNNGTYLIEIGKVREEGLSRQYRYDDGRLIQRTF